MGTRSAKRRVAAATLVVAAGLAAPVIAAETPEWLDPQFGTRGFQSTEADFTGSAANRVVVTPGGKIIASGVGLHGLGEDSDSDFAVVGYTSKGELDRGFADKGSIVFDFGTSYVIDTPRSLALTADNKILVGGLTQDPEADYEGAAGVARLTSDGELDTSLAGDGTLLASPEGLERATEVLPLADGDFYVVGPADRAVAVARFNADGSLDPAFGGDGVASVDLGSRIPVGHAVLTPTGEIVAITAGGLVRVDAAGVPDPAFGTEPPVDDLYELARAPDGSLYAAGERAVVRFSADGQVDESFADGGVFRFSGASGFAASGVAVASDGSLAVSGSAGAKGKKKYFAVARLKRNGRLDRGFGERGFATVKRGSAALGLTFTAAGKILAVGRTLGRSIFFGDIAGRDTKVAIARFLNR